MQNVNALWIGKKLGPIHAACLKSFVRNGYEVTLHSYGRPDDTPNGVKIFDANLLMKEEEIFRHQSGNLALVSDVYRYRIQREGLGLYVDCDVYCLKPIENNDYILGWEDQNTVNGAVLKLPQNSEILRSVLKAAENPYFIPPWLSKNKMRFTKLKRMLGRRKHVSKQAWGTIGPHLITYLVKELRLEKKVSPIDVFYPMHYSCTSLLHEKGLRVNDLITPRTTAFHLYNTANNSKELKPDTPLFEIINS